MGARGETAGWLVGLLGAGTGVLFVASATAPIGSAGDWWDSRLFFPLTLAVGGLAGVAGYRAPRHWLTLGLIAMLPYYAAQLGVGIQEMLRGHGQGLLPVGFVFLIPLTALPVVAASIGSGLRRRRSPAE